MVMQLCHVSPKEWGRVRSWSDLAADLSRCAAQGQDTSLGSVCYSTAGRPSTGNNCSQWATLWVLNKQTNKKITKYQPLAHHFTQLRIRHWFIWQWLWTQTCITWLQPPHLQGWAAGLEAAQRVLTAEDGLHTVLQLLSDEKIKYRELSTAHLKNGKSRQHFNLGQYIPGFLIICFSAHWDTKNLNLLLCK